MRCVRKDASIPEGGGGRPRVCIASDEFIAKGDIADRRIDGYRETAILEALAAVRRKP
jgi:hypothetical protein